MDVPSASSAPTLAPVPVGRLRDVGPTRREGPWETVSGCVRGRSVRRVETQWRSRPDPARQSACAANRAGDGGYEWKSPLGTHTRSPPPTPTSPSPIPPHLASGRLPFKDRPAVDEPRRTCTPGSCPRGSGADGRDGVSGVFPDEVVHGAPTSVHYNVSQTPLRTRSRDTTLTPMTVDYTSQWL